MSGNGVRDRLINAVYTPILFWNFSFTRFESYNFFSHVFQVTLSEPPANVSRSLRFISLRQHLRGCWQPTDTRREVNCGLSIFLARRHESRSCTPMRWEVEELLCQLIRVSLDRIEGTEEMMIVPDIWYPGGQWHLPQPTSSIGRVLQAKVWGNYSK